MREELTKLGELGKFNLTRIAAHAGSPFLYYMRFAGALLTELKLDPKLRELAVLVVAENRKAEYEWAQHVVLARALGVEEAQIAAVARGDLEAECFDAAARSVVCWTAQALATGRPSDAAMASLRGFVDTQEIVELLFVVGNYQMLALMMTTLDIEMDPALGEVTVDVAARRIAEEAMRHQT
jgi:alkylhydroperoxidase family enzyme